ncbi:MAG: hypothetical protein M3256_17650 [Actinomycetota bacterium]|nr:hypothetical protein [Actinomycetota bacterium]
MVPGKATLDLTCQNGLSCLEAARCEDTFAFTVSAGGQLEVDLHHGDLTLAGEASSALVSDGGNLQDLVGFEGAIPSPGALKLETGALIKCWTLIFGRRHLEHVMTEYGAHYDTARPHRAIKLDAPIPLEPATDTGGGIGRVDRLGGLVHEYRPVA